MPLVVVVSPSNVAPGGSLTVTLSGFTPNTSVWAGFVAPLPILASQNPAMILINSAGSGSTVFQILSTAAPNAYTLYIFDSVTGITLTQTTFNVVSGGGGGGGTDQFIIIAVGLAIAGIALIVLFSGGGERRRVVYRY